MNQLMRSSESPPHAMLEALLARRDLDVIEAEDLLRMLANSALPAALGGALLIALRAKGVTATELRGLAQAMRSLAKAPRLPARADAIDLVGTGGDASSSLNLSTGAALLTAACGLPVIKHGNRSVSSRSGSADVLERLGLPMPLDEHAAGTYFTRVGFTFLFAPYYHGAMQALGSVRKALKLRTAFNLLGPLTNPAAPRYALIGAYDIDAARLIAEALLGMETERAWVVHGSNGWDEATPLGPFTVFDVGGGAVRNFTLDPLDLGVARAQPSALAGGDAEFNAAAIRGVLEGRDAGAHADALTLQAGMALHIAGREPDVPTGILRAREALASGRAARWLLDLDAATGHAAP